jgi:hypothetical protein
MPKQLYKIIQFHGGLSSNSDARDIAENELADANDIMVDEVGRIRMLGGTTNHVAVTPEDDQGTGWNNGSDPIIPGYGLFYFSHDRVGAEDKGSSEAETGDDYLAIYDGNDGQIWIYSRVGDTWDDDAASANNGVIDIGSSNTTTAQVNFYAVDGALRVCDGNFANSNTNQWYGYTDIRHFGALTPGGAADTYDKWLTANAEIAAPTRGLAGVLTIAIVDGTGSSDTDTIRESNFFSGWSGEIENNHIALCDNAGGSGPPAVGGTAIIDTYTDESNVDTILSAPHSPWDWTGKEVDIFPPAGTGFNIDIWDDSATITPGVPAGTYEVASTFIYDAEPGEPTAQESLPFKLAMKTFAVDAEDRIRVKVYATSPYSARIRGGRIYMRIVNSNDPWNQIVEISLKDGVRLSPNDEYTAWGHLSDTNNNTTICMANTSDLYITELLPITYENNTGISQDAPSITAKYKTSVIANRIAYIGNVQYNGDNYGDAVFKSPVNKFDIFTSDRRLEANINDGDSIVKLEAYADRLLIFKKNKLELLNISQEVEFVEDTFIHKGVSHPAATCKTDFGIAWVNKQGCYLYDGQRVSNLLEKGGRQIIKESIWATFTANEPMIGYIPKKRQIIVADDIAADGTGAAYLYDIVTQSWVTGAAATFDDQKKTNFITDWNGDLAYAHTTGNVVKWDDAGDDSTAFSIQTKDIDFGQPAQKKKVYKVYITYTGVSSLSVLVRYQINGDGGWTAFSSGGTLNASSGQNEATLTLSSPVECYSFQLSFTGTAKTTFEINDMSIVYRLKGIR